MNATDYKLEDSYQGYCACCGSLNTYLRTSNSLREGYSCSTCRASLRYRGQAELIVNLFGHSDTNCLAQLLDQSSFLELDVFEPGISGQLRPYLSKVPSYQKSYFWPDVEPGDQRNDVRCENLENMTFDNESFDLIVSSDILEHVRRPIDAFKDIYRILKPGGWHVFSIPVQLPMPSKSHYRVDTSTDEDIHTVEAHYHGDGAGGRSLVYVDYGADIVQELMTIGYSVYLHTPSDNNSEAQKLVTFATKKRHCSL